jgi:hypothetical protein
MIQKLKFKGQPASERLNTVHWPPATALSLLPRWPWAFSRLP